ncbi:MAG: YpbF family protein [Bacillus sp. (in: firmicutes)]
MSGTDVKWKEEWTDQATKKMLQNVIKRKEKFDMLKRKHFWTTIVTLTTAFLLIIYIYYLYVKPYSYSFLELIDRFTSSGNSLFYSLLVFSLYGYMLILKRKMDKAEKEFHALRCEIVDRSKDLWKKEEAWKQRHLVFKEMKDRYDINLYHENK